MIVSRRRLLSAVAILPATRLLAGRPARAALTAPGAEDAWASGFVYLGLHENAPGYPEVKYDGYRRVAVRRSDKEWIVEDCSVRNRHEIKFPECRGGLARADRVSVMTSAGRILFYATLPSILISRGLAIIFEAEHFRINLGEPGPGTAYSDLLATALKRDLGLPIC